MINYLGKITPIKSIEPNQGLLVRSLTMAPEPKPGVPTKKVINDPIPKDLVPKVKETSLTSSGKDLTVIHA